MRTQFKANIEENGLGGWLIRITNTQNNQETICNDLDEFSNQIEYLGLPYDNDIEVLWSKEDNLTNEHFYEVKHQMASINKDINKND